MYLQYYGFQDYPFAVTPDPAFLFLGTPHREALGHLLYGAGEHGGFVQLTGEVGTGKTTLIRALLDNRVPDLDVALCWHPQLDVLEFVATICDELGVAYDAQRDITLKALVDRLNEHLLHTHAAGRRTLLIIDEAQNLSRDVLEQLRLLTNLETSKHKLLQIILVGQPEMDAFLARHDLRQLTQRISARFELKPLDRQETCEYINHRLACVGGTGRLFTPAACQLVYWYTRGTPRLINLLCERALMGAYAHGQATIGPLTVRRAAREVLARKQHTHTARRWLWPGVAAAATLAVALWGLSPTLRPEQVLAWATHSDGGLVSEAQAATLEPGTHHGAATKKTAVAPSRHADASVQTTAAAGQAPEINAKPLFLNAFKNKSVRDQSRHTTQLAAAGKTAQTAGDHAEATVVLPPGPATPLPQGDAELSQLLRLWGVFGAEVEASCASLHVGDLRCLSNDGTLALLERFNRPAILFLQHDGQQQRVLVTELSANSATLTGAQGSRRIDRARLARLWNGKFFMIWRASAGVTYIHDYMIGSAVVWLRRRLTEAAGKNPDAQLGPESPIFDAELEARVRHFQLMHGLKPDGVAGPRTQIMLNGLSPAPGTPTLEPEPVDKD